MAITITKEPSGIYPAYNDSYVQFSSDLADNYKAEITVLPISIFTRVFVIYANASGIYLFNLKEAVKVILNEAGFEDASFFTTANYKSFSGLYLSQGITIKVLSDSASEQVNKTYEFFKAVNQVGSSIHSNPFQLLTYSEDGINHSMTYFEGWPFHFDIQRIINVQGLTLEVENTTTGGDFGNIQVSFTGSFRMNVDRGGGVNWTSLGVLPLIEGLNDLKIYESGDFRSNLALTKRIECAGVYLKWFNNAGGYSHFLFNRFYVDSIEGRDLGLVASSQFNNIEDVIGDFRSIGKKASRSFVLKVRYNSIEYQNIKGILASPLVQMYTEFNANITGKYIDVKVNGSMKYSNKRGMNELALNVNLPEIITAKL